MTTQAQGSDLKFHKAPAFHILHVIGAHLPESINTTIGHERGQEVETRVRRDRGDDFSAISASPAFLPLAEGCIFQERIYAVQDVSVPATTFLSASCFGSAQ